MLNKGVRKWLVILWIGLLFSGISLLFWYNEWVYSLPTPVPFSYHDVKIGEYIDLSEKKLQDESKLIFLHFFNPGCPCSKFNIPHFKSLVKEFGSKVSFAIVVLNKEMNYTEKDIQEKFDLNIPVLFDKSVAIACGVYSTPQAVILDSAHKLYYRGNYNKSRYCTDKTSSYAKTALDSLLKNNLPPIFDELSTTAYGCQLPTCNK